MKFLNFSEYSNNMKGVFEKKNDSDKGNNLSGKKVVLKNMKRKGLGILDGSNGKIIKSFKENEREPEGDLPRREGDPPIYKIKLDKPKDPMHPEINLSPEYFSINESVKCINF